MVTGPNWQGRRRVDGKWLPFGPMHTSQAAAIDYCERRWTINDSTCWKVVKVTKS